MKIAVYTIALNEEQHALEFMRRCRQADYVVVGDTGSTDATNEIVQDMGGTIVPVAVRPWRFDIPRNTVLSLLPDVDFCIAPDFDEYLPENWREIIETHWRPDQYDRLRFRYAHSLNKDGSPARVGIKNFGHTRFNYSWRHIVHEKLYYDGPGEERSLTLTNFLVEHRQDLTKSRGSYLPLLEWECQSQDTTPQHLFWLIREYADLALWDKMQPVIDKYLAIQDTWAVERAYAYCYQARAAAAARSPQAGTHYAAAIQTAPEERAIWLEAAKFWMQQEDWGLAYVHIVQCLSITHRSEHYLSPAEAWGVAPYILAAKCALALKIPATPHLLVAKSLEPDNAEVQKLLQQADLPPTMD